MVAPNHSFFLLRVAIVFFAIISDVGHGCTFRDSPEYIVCKYTLVYDVLAEADRIPQVVSGENDAN